MPDELLDDWRALGQFAAATGFQDHLPGYAVLHCEGVLQFELGVRPNAGRIRAGGDAEPDQRSVADRVDYRVMPHGRRPRRAGH